MSEREKATEAVKTIFNGCLGFVTISTFACSAVLFIPPLFAAYRLTHLWAVAATVGLLPTFLAAFWVGRKMMVAPFPEPYEEHITFTSPYSRNDRVLIILGGIWIGGIFLFGAIWGILDSTSTLPPQTLHLWALGVTLCLCLIALGGYRFGRMPMEDRRKGPMLWLGFLLLLFGVGIPLTTSFSTSEKAGLLFGLVPGLLFCYAMALSWDPVRLAPFRIQSGMQSLMYGLALALVPLLMGVATLTISQFTSLRAREFFNGSLLTLIILFLSYVIVQAWRYRPRYDMGWMREVVAQFADVRSLPEARALLEQHPALLGHEADRTLEDMIVSKWEDRAEMARLEEKRRLLARCRKVGIARAFEEIEGARNHAHD